MTQPPPALEFDQVTLRLGGRNVLEDISFCVESGQFVGVFGPNGAGKTTLMRTIAGVIRPHCGAVRVFGQAVAQARRQIGYMPQMRSFSGVMLTGRTFVGVGINGTRWGLPYLGRAARREVERVLDLVGVTHLADRPLAELSGGERQSLLLAQALVGRPRVVLLDEPLAGLDPSRMRHVVQKVRQLQQQEKFTVLFSAHELNALLGVMDRVLYLGRHTARIGRVSEVITSSVLSELYDMPIDVVRTHDRIFVLTSGVEAMGACPCPAQP